MNREEFQTLFELEEAYWWFVGMRGITASLLRKIDAPQEALHVLDAGCGTGIMLSWLEWYTRIRPVVGVDSSPEALEFCKRRGHRSISRASVTHLPLRSGCFDLVTCFDVFQFLPLGHDQRALAELHRVLRSNGRIILRVASYEWLWSGHDDAQGATHRYTIKELTEKVQRAGFKIERATYANTVLFPIAVLKRLMKQIGIGHPGSDVRMLPSWLGWLNRYLAAILLMEANLLSVPSARLPFGLSIFCLARKIGTVS